MNITDQIAVLIETFSDANDGRSPTVLRMGRRQIAALKQFASRYLSTPAANGLGPNYDGIRILEMDEEDHLSAEIVEPQIPKSEL